MASDSEKCLVDKLKSNDTSKVYEALLKIRKSYTRNIPKMKKLQKLSVIELILPYMEHPKYCNISLSIVADICLNLSFADKVIKLNGVESLMRIMKSLVNDEVQNRACRALGNIAKFQIGLRAIKFVKPVPSIIKFVNETTDVNCQITAVRTLTILGNNPETRELIVKENGVICIARLLESSNVDVLNSSIKAIANLTKNCSIACGRQLLELDFFQSIVELYSRSEKSIQDNVLLSLKNLSSLEEIRGGLIKVGAVKLFVDVLSNHETYDKGHNAALALCNCLDHVHMWSHHGIDRAVGLKALLVILQNENFQEVHKHVITSLIPLSYESQSQSQTTAILLDLNLIKVLIQLLSSFIENHKCKYITKFSEDEIYGIETETSLLHGIKRKDSLTDGKEIQYLNMTNSFFNSSFTNKCFYDSQNQSHNTKIGDYVRTHSPTEICSPIRKLCTSPGCSDSDQSSPVYSFSRSWSPISDTGEYFLQQEICWSPVVSCGSDSPSRDEDQMSSSDSIFENTSDISLIIENIGDSPDKNGNIEETNSSSNDLDKPLLDKVIPVDSIEQSEKAQLDATNKVFNDQDSRKRMRTDISDECECLKVPYGIHAVENKNKEIKSEKTKSNLKKCNRLELKLNIKNNLSSESSFDEKKTIDHYIIRLIFQLSFHLEKKPDSQIADKACFSVLMDYLCFIHYPSPKAEVILLNLIKNRYCFEKLALNGFILEMEDRIASFDCSNHDLSNLNHFYANLLTNGRQEAESDFGVGTLAHILVTSEKENQFQVLCAISKLVTQKAALLQLLFQANGLPLLLKFLVDNCTLTRKKAIICLCEIYQSLTKEFKPQKCCFAETCRLKMSEICSYQKAYLNVTFLVDNGEKILANRERLCENSEYFKALLKGSFLETDCENVTLPYISAETLSTIFHFLHGCGSGYCCPYIKYLTLPVLLELLSNCDRFLLMDFKTLVEDQLCHQLYPDTISRIYAKSKVYSSPALTTRALQFALNMDVKDKLALWNCFDQLINLEANVSILCDIEFLLKSLM